MAEDLAMHESDLTDLRERILDLKKDLRAISLPLLTTTAQLGERIISTQDGLQELRETVRALWEHVNALEQQPLTELRQSRVQRVGFRQTLASAVIGAVVSGVVFALLHLFGVA